MTIHSSTSRFPLVPIARSFGLAIGTLASFAATGTNAISISTSLPMVSRHEATAVADGRPETWFESARPTRDGDDFLVQFPEPIRPDRIRVLSGDREQNKRIEFATLKVSVDGTNFTFAARFLEGAAVAASPPAPMRALRLRFTGGGSDAVAIREIDFGTALGTPARFVTRVEVDCTRFWHFEPGTWKPEIDPDQDSFRSGYRVTAAFLAWLVGKHDPEIVRKLNTASRRRQPAPPVFLEATGKALDVLWREFADGFRRPPQP